MKLLLDTHIWIWSVFGDQRLARANVTIIGNASSLYVSAISAWEIAMLVHLKRLALHQDPRAWLERSLAITGAEIIPLDANTALESYALPGEFHSDPADRMIVATARHKGLTLMTQDKSILAYAKKGYIKIAR